MPIRLRRGWSRRRRWLGRGLGDGGEEKEIVIKRFIGLCNKWSSWSNAESEGDVGLADRLRCYMSAEWAERSLETTWCRRKVMKAWTFQKQAKEWMGSPFREGPVRDDKERMEIYKCSM